MADATVMKPVTRRSKIAAATCSTNATTVLKTHSVPQPSATSKTPNGCTMRIPQPTSSAR